MDRSTYTQELQEKRELRVQSAIPHTDLDRAMTKGNQINCVATGKTSSP